MKKPSMILFDYGQTLVDERPFDAVKGNAAVMAHAASNPHGLSPGQVQRHANALIAGLGDRNIEYSCIAFNNYLYASLGIQLSISGLEMEELFWNNAAGDNPTPGIQEFLDFLWEQGIRTGVISNITFSGHNLKKRIDRILPNHHFEFILASSDYLFRKPDPRLFQLALELSGLSPQQCWYIGDNPDCDVNGSRGLGMLPVWYAGALVKPVSSPVPSALSISSWDQLRAVLEEESIPTSCQPQPMGV